jgi:hypothetical protein
VATYAVPHACVHSCKWCSGVHSVYVMLHEVARPSTMAGSSFMHVVHGNEDAQRAACRAHKLAAKRTAFAHRTHLTPDNIAERMVMYTQKHFGNLPLHPIQAIRLMVLSGHFVLSP